MTYMAHASANVQFIGLSKARKKDKKLPKKSSAGLPARAHDAKAPWVAAVATAPQHGFCKQAKGAITLTAGRGVEEDAHCGATVQHLYDKAKDPARPNLRQVHLIEEELIEDLRTVGFDIEVGAFGENVRIRNLKLTGLPVGTRLKLGEQVILAVTGLRAPCLKIDRFKIGLRRAVTARRDGHAYVKSAVMAVVIEGGIVRVGDEIHLERCRDGPRIPLRPV
jgi:MOSC domain-containing protein YiiM